MTVAVRGTLSAMGMVPIRRMLGTLRPITVRRAAATISRRGTLGTVGPVAVSRAAGAIVPGRTLRALHAISVRRAFRAIRAPTEPALSVSPVAIGPVAIGRSLDALHAITVGGVLAAWRAITVSTALSALRTIAVRPPVGAAAFAIPGWMSRLAAAPGAVIRGPTLFDRSAGVWAVSAVARAATAGL